MKENKFRNNSVNLVFSSIDDLLDKFSSSYTGNAKIVRVAGRHLYSHVNPKINRPISMTIVYLVETKDNPTGKVFDQLSQEEFNDFVKPYDTVLQLTRISFDGGDAAEGMLAHKVYGHTNSKL